MAQNIASHQWENRVLLILTDNIDTPIFQNQIKELQTHENELSDRKLIIYKIKEDSYTKGFKDAKWEQSTKLYKTYKTANTPFKVMLIGLNGGIKRSQNNLLTCKTLFETIDVMPMRKAELKKNKN